MRRIKSIAIPFKYRQDPTSLVFPGKMNLVAAKSVLVFVSRRNCPSTASSRFAGLFQSFRCLHVRVSKPPLHGAKINTRPVSGLFLVTLTRFIGESFIGTGIGITGLQLPDNNRPAERVGAFFDEEATRVMNETAVLDKPQSRNPHSSESRAFLGSSARPEKFLPPRISRS
jgi:hypothetical protein